MFSVLVSITLIFAMIEGKNRLRLLQSVGITPSPILYSKRRRHLSYAPSLAALTYSNKHLAEFLLACGRGKGTFHIQE